MMKRTFKDRVPNHKHGFPHNIMQRTEASSSIGFTSHLTAGAKASGVYDLGEWLVLERMTACFAMRV